MPYEADVTLTSKGQMTLPAEVRKQWNIKAGDKLRLVLQEDGSAVLAPRKPKRFLEYVRSLPSTRSERPVDETMIQQAIKSAVTERYRRGLRTRP